MCTVLQMPEMKSLPQKTYFDTKIVTVRAFEAKIWQFEFIITRNLAIFEGILGWLWGVTSTQPIAFKFLLYYFGTKSPQIRGCAIKNSNICIFRPPYSPV